MRFRIWNLRFEICNSQIETLNVAQELIDKLDDWGLHWIAQHGWVVYLLWGLVQVALILALVMTCVAVYTWMERKISGRIQDRLGPSRVGGRFGWLQPAADGLKLLCKEDIVPAGADGLLFRVAPYLSFCAAFMPFLALPFAPGWVVQPLDTAAFFILAIGGLEVFGVILAGYASGSKWSLYGAMREAAQVVSFEIPLGMCVVVPVLMAGTMNLTEIAQQQAGWFTNWNLVNPFALATFLIYMVCATAGTNRAPFDLPEAESELVAGFMTEYSGFRWAMFFMAEYCAMFLLALLGAILFCGGWNGPIPVASMLGLTPEQRFGRRFHRQLPRHVQPDRQRLPGRDLHDVAPLDAAPAPHRPGHDHLPEVLRAAGLDHARRHDGLDVRSPRRVFATQQAARAAGEAEPADGNRLPCKFGRVAECELQIAGKGCRKQ